MIKVNINLILYGILLIIIALTLKKFLFKKESLENTGDFLKFSIPKETVVKKVIRVVENEELQDYLNDGVNILIDRLNSIPKDKELEFDDNTILQEANEYVLDIIDTAVRNGKVFEDHDYSYFNSLREELFLSLKESLKESVNHKPADGFLKDIDFINITKKRMLDLDNKVSLDSKIVSSAKNIMHDGVDTKDLIKILERSQGKDPNTICIITEEAKAPTCWNTKKLCYLSNNAMGCVKTIISMPKSMLNNISMKSNESSMIDMPQSMPKSMQEPMPAVKQMN